MSFTSTDEAATADTLRRSLVEELLATGAITTAAVEAAFRAVPRHVFAPEVSLVESYANDIVRTKYDEHGMTISSVSAPWLKAAMLERARIQPGMRCLEIGSGGYNAALIAELVGPTGAVTTVDIDADVTERARRFLDAAGYDRVEVVHGDAEHGVAATAPYDRIIVTVGVWDIPPAWRDQLTTGGRIVVPLRMRGLKRTMAFDCAGDTLVSDEHMMAGFVDVQGAGAHPERVITLHGEEVRLRFEDDPDAAVDAAAMRAALTQPRVDAWSGVTFGNMESFDGLFLWLATALDRYCVLSRARTGTARELVNPASAIATPTLLSDSSFAYLTFRATAEDPDRFEFGAHAHGPDAADLADTMVQQIRVWDDHHRGGPPARITVTPERITGPGRGEPARATPAQAAHDRLDLLARGLTRAPLGPGVLRLTTTATPRKGTAMSSSATIPAAEQVIGRTSTDGGDLFDLDISLVESSPVIPELLRSTSDNCGGTCGSACTSCSD